MNRIGQYTKTKSEIPEEYTKWQEDPTPENYNGVIQHLGSTISTGMHSFGNKDLRVRGRIIVDKALRSYDHTKGASLKSHVYNNLKGLQRVRSDRQRAVHVPEHVRLNKTHITDFEKKYHDKHGLMPSDETIADKMNLSTGAVARTRGSGETREIRNDKGDSVVSKNRTEAEIWTDYVYHDVDDTNKKIMEWSMGYNNKPTMTKSQIAAALKISPAAVSSRISTITRKMEKGLDDGTGSL